MELSDRTRVDGRSGDAERLGQARAGDAAAYRVVVEARLPGAWRLARAILGSDEAASEAVVTAVTAAWRELPRLPDLGRFDDWFDRILLAECRMRLASLTAAEPGAGGASTPADLLERAMLALEQAPPQAAAPSAPSPTRRTARLRAVVTWLGLLALVIGVAAAGVLVLRPRAAPIAGRDGSSPSAPGSGVGASSPSPSSDPGIGTPGPTLSPPATGALRVGGLAMVTLGGDNLRVRSAPGVGSDSTKLRPLLPGGTRMLIVDGPVFVDGYDWYEVQTDGELINLFGWVAAADGERTWIAPVEPRCWPTLDGTALASLTSVDFLACYGTAEVRVQAQAEALWDARGREGDCGWVRARDGCDVDRAWLLLPPATVRIVTSTGEEKDVRVAIPPDMAAELAKLPRQSSLDLTLAMDDPAAAGCRIRDSSTGRTLIPDAQAVTACRLQPVIQVIRLSLGEGTGSGS